MDTFRVEKYLFLLIVGCAACAFADNKPQVKSTVFFRENSTELIPEAIAVLKAQATLIREKTPEKLLLVGYCDSQEKVKPHFGLDRAQAVGDKLVELGVDPKKVSIYRDDSPELLYKDDAPASHAFNRRVTISY